MRIPNIQSSIDVQLKENITINWAIDSDVHSHYGILLLNFTTEIGKRYLVIKSEPLKSAANRLLSWVVKKLGRLP